MTWKINHAAVRHIAAHDYGILGPVSVKRTRSRMGRGDQAVGQHILWSRERNGWLYVEHVIRLDGTRPPECVAVSLAHELQHAADAESIMRETYFPDPFAAAAEWLRDEFRPYGQRHSERRARAAGERYGGLVLSECFS